VSSRLTRRIQPAPAASQPPTLHSRLPRPIHERISHEALPGVHSRSPVRPFPSPVFPPNGTGDLRLYPRASHPAVTSDARRDRDRPMDTGLGSHLRTHSTSTLVDPLTVWDFVSHRLGHPVPPRDSALLTVGLPPPPRCRERGRTLTRFPCFARGRPDWVWVSSVPRGRRCSRDRSVVLGRRLPPLNGVVPATPVILPVPGFPTNEASSRIHGCSPAQPSPRL
jgi:hypothetical protein